MRGMFYNDMTNTLENAYAGVMGSRAKVGDVSNEVLAKPDSLKKAGLVEQAAHLKNVLSDTRNLFVLYAKDASQPVPEELASDLHASFADALKNLDVIVGALKTLPSEKAEVNDEEIDNED